MLEYLFHLKKKRKDDFFLQMSVLLPGYFVVKVKDSVGSLPAKSPFSQPAGCNG